MKRFWSWFRRVFWPEKDIGVVIFEPEISFEKEVPVLLKRNGIPGSKVARRMMKARGLPYDGEVFHTGELTKLNNERRAARAEARRGSVRAKCGII